MRFFKAVLVTLSIEARVQTISKKAKIYSVLSCIQLILNITTAMCIYKLPLYMNNIKIINN